jgi:enoyl-CoA hydratase
MTTTATPGVDAAQFRTILCERDDAVATVVLTRPEALNALDALMFNELEALFTILEADPAIRVILLTGAGERAFAAGADIGDLLHTDASSGGEVSARGQQVFSQIEGCCKPVIACINGVALGGGCELAMACTLRLASDKARLGLPEVRLGLIPGYAGTHRLPKLVGRGVALRMMLTAQIVDANEARRIGLVEEVYPAADLMRHAKELAQTICKMAPLAILGLLQAIGHNDSSLSEGMLRETEIFSRLCATADKHEGLTAFLEKRPAQWNGR